MIHDVVDTRTGWIRKLKEIPEKENDKEYGIDKRVRNKLKEVSKVLEKKNKERKIDPSHKNMAKNDPRRVEKSHFKYLNYQKHSKIRDVTVTKKGKKAQNTSNSRHKKKKPGINIDIKEATVDVEKEEKKVDQDISDGYSEDFSN